MKLKKTGVRVVGIEHGENVVKVISMEAFRKKKNLPAIIRSYKNGARMSMAKYIEHWFELNKLLNEKL